MDKLLSAHPVTRPRPLLIPLLALSVLVPMPTVLAQPENQEREIRLAVQNWLLTRCDVGDENPPALPQAPAKAVEALLIDAARNGPPKALRRRLASDLREYWATRRDALTSGASGLGPPLSAQLLEEPEQDYVQENLDDFVRGYREKAIAALAALPSEEARSVLEQIAADPQDDLGDRSRRSMADRSAADPID